MLQKGDVVWIRTNGLPWWPGYINELVSEKKNVPVSLSILWFGDHCISQENRKKLKCFTSGFKECYTPDGNQTYQMGVKHALKVIAARRGYPDKPDDKLINWALKGFVRGSGRKEDSLTVPEFLQNILDSISVTIKTRKRKNESNKGDGNLREASDSDSDEDYKDDFSQETEELIEKLDSGEVRIESVCLGCQKTDCSSSENHPVFKGGLCRKCKVDFIEVQYAIDSESGMHIACQVCSSLGFLLYCDNFYCRKACCEHCLRIFCNIDPLNSSFYKDPGLCLMCAPFTKESHGSLKKRKRWRQKVDSLFHPADGLLLDVVTCKPDALKALCCYDSRSVAKRTLESLGKSIKTIDLYQPNFFANRRAGGRPKLPDISEYDFVVAVMDSKNIYVDLGGRETDDSAVQLTTFFQLVQESRNGCLYLLLQTVATQADSSKFLTRFLRRYPFQLKSGNASQNPYWVWSNMPNVYDVLNPFEETKISVWEERSVPSNVLRKKIFRCGEVPLASGAEAGSTSGTSVMEEDYIANILRKVLSQVVKVPGS